MWNVIECAGHPRDLGFEQGLALRSAIRQCAEKAGLPTQRRRWPGLSAYAGGRVRGSGTAREMIRHFTHLAERADGLARGAGIPLDSILRLQGATNFGKQGALALCATDVGGATGASLVRTLSGAPWLVRRSRPEVGFASLEITEAWQVSGLAGVNEVGLAACMVPGLGDPLAPAVELATPCPPAASSHFLVQECLQRFEEVEAGIGWCLSRPSAGEGTILLADAAGHRGAVHFGPGGVAAERAGSGPVIAGTPARAIESLGAWMSSSDADRGSLAHAMGAEAGSTMLRLICAENRLELQDGADQERILSLRMDPGSGVEGTPR